MTAHGDAVLAPAAPGGHGADDREVPAGPNIFKQFAPISTLPLTGADISLWVENIGADETHGPKWGIHIQREPRGLQMSRFQFSVRGLDSRREGVIESESFIAAVDALGQHVDVQTGDLLEIGVLGFPPARYQCVGEIKSGFPMWIPEGQLAA